MSVISLIGVMHFWFIMRYPSPSFTAIALTVFSLSGFSFLAVKEASAAPWNHFDGACTAKGANTHDCLEPLPTYSYHLALPSNYQQNLCVDLGSWDGDNDVIVEWDGLQARHRITGKAQQRQMLQPEQRDGMGSGVIVYSQRPIFPDLLQGSCKSSKGATDLAVTPSPWPTPDQNNVATLRERLANNGVVGVSSDPTTPQVSIVGTP